MKHLTLLTFLILAGCSSSTGEAVLVSPDAGDAAAWEFADGGETMADVRDVVVAPDAGSDAPVDTTPCGGACGGEEPVCDEANGYCVQCLGADDCGADAPFCEENYCVACAADDETCTDPDPPDPDPEPTDPESFNIRFATYNVRTSNLLNSAWGDNNRTFDSNDDDRMKRVADTIVAQNLTVVAAQEIRRPERDAILRRLTNKHQQNWNHTSVKQGRDDTQVLFMPSVWRKMEETHYIIPMQPGLEDRYQVGVRLRHRATGQDVWFYSVHFAAGRTDASAQARDEAARKTVRSIQNHAVDKNLKFVLGGDFNTTSGGSVGDIFRNSNFMKYTRSAADQKVNNGCKTFNGNAGSAGQQDCPGGAASHIDHVWVSKGGMKVRKYQVIANTRTSRASDHNPVMTILTKL